MHSFWLYRRAHAHVQACHASGHSIMMCHERGRMHPKSAGAHHMGPKMLLTIVLYDNLIFPKW